MRIDIDRRSNRIVVHCFGRLDVAGARELEERILPLWTGGGEERIQPVFLDLAGVDYLSSAGIRSLIIARRSAAKRQPPASPAGSELRLVNLTANVRQVLEIAGLLDELTGDAVPGAPAGTCETPDGGYGHRLEDVRLTFPVPVSDPVRDGYFVNLVAHSLEVVDRLKTERPFLGERRELDYTAARRAVMPETMSSLEEMIGQLSGYLEGLSVWGHPRAQENVVGPASIPSIMGQLFASIFNPNIIWDEYSHRLAQAEVEVSSMCAAMVGYDPAVSSGVFTFGGTGTVLYGVKVGLEKAIPGAFRKGIREDVRVVASEAGHYAKLNSLGWLGMGTDNLVSVPSDQDNSMKLHELEAILRRQLDQGRKIGCIIATMGTTDAFGIDNLEYIVGLRDRLVEEYSLDYRPHVHADAVIGWAWTVFNDYDFEANPLEFGPRTLRSLWDASLGVRTIGLADSVGIDFHKTGYTPYISSLFIVRDHADMSLIARDQSVMPYLFQFGNYHPGEFTLETSRSGGSVLAALANLKALGKEGYRILLGHIVTMAESLRRRLELAGFAAVANSYNYGPVTLFRLYPEGVEAKTAYRREVTDADAAAEVRTHNDYNRRISEILRRQMDAGDGLALSMTDRYRVSASGEPILALKSFVMSPFVDEAAMDRLMDCLGRARQELEDAAA